MNSYWTITICLHLHSEHSCPLLCSDDEEIDQFIHKLNHIQVLEMFVLL